MKRTRADLTLFMPTSLYDVIPLEIIRSEIIRHLNRIDIILISSTCKTFRTVVCSPWKKSLRFELWMIFALAELGHLSILKWIFEEQQWLVPRSCWSYRVSGELEDNNFYGNMFYLSLCHSAAWGGKLDVVTWAAARGWDCDIAYIIRNIPRKHGHVLQWATSQPSARMHVDDLPDEIVEHVIMFYLDKASLLSVAHTCRRFNRLVPRKKIHVPLDRMVVSLMQHGSIPLVKWFIQECYLPLSDKLVYAAAVHGHLHLLEWLRDKGCDWHVYTWQAVAINGHLDTFKWLVDQNASWFFAEEIVSFAVVGGQLNVLEWIYAHAESATYDVSIVVTLVGCLDTFKWIHEHFGLVHVSLLYSLAVDREEHDIVTYLREQFDIEILNNDLRIYSRPFINGLPILSDDHLFSQQRNPYEWKKAAAVAKSGHLDVRKWIRKYGHPCL